MRRIKEEKRINSHDEQLKAIRLFCDKDCSARLLGTKHAKHIDHAIRLINNKKSEPRFEVKDCPRIDCCLHTFRMQSEENARNEKNR